MFHEAASAGGLIFTMVRMVYDLHNLPDMIKEIEELPLDDTEQKVFAKLERHKDFLNQIVRDKIFVNSRYMDLPPDYIQTEFDRFWELLIDVDEIAVLYFKVNELVHVVYPDSML